MNIEKRTLEFRAQDKTAALNFQSLVGLPSGRYVGFNTITSLTPTTIKLGSDEFRTFTYEGVIQYPTGMWVDNSGEIILEDYADLRTTLTITANPSTEDRFDVVYGIHKHTNIVGGVVPTYFIMVGTAGAGIPSVPTILDNTPLMVLKMPAGATSSHAIELVEALPIPDFATDSSVAHTDRDEHFVEPVSFYGGVIQKYTTAKLVASLSNPSAYVLEPFDVTHDFYVLDDDNFSYVDYLQVVNYNTTGNRFFDFTNPLDLTATGSMVRNIKVLTKHNVEVTQSVGLGVETFRFQVGDIIEMTMFSNGWATIVPPAESRDLVMENQLTLKVVTGSIVHVGGYNYINYVGNANVVIVEVSSDLVISGIKTHHLAKDGNEVKVLFKQTSSSYSTKYKIELLKGSSIVTDSGGTKFLQFNFNPYSEGSSLTEDSLLYSDYNIDTELTFLSISNRFKLLNGDVNWYHKVPHTVIGTIAVTPIPDWWGVRYYPLKKNLYIGYSLIDILPDDVDTNVVTLPEVISIYNNELPNRLLPATPQPIQLIIEWGSIYRTATVLAEMRPYVTQMKPTVRPFSTAILGATVTTATNFRYDIFVNIPV